MLTEAKSGRTFLMEYFSLKHNWQKYLKTSNMIRVGSVFWGEVFSVEKYGSFRPGRNRILPFLPISWKKPIPSTLFAIISYRCKGIVWHQNWAPFSFARTRWTYDTAALFLCNICIHWENLSIMWASLFS